MKMTPRTQGADSARLLPSSPPENSFRAGGRASFAQRPRRTSTSRYLLACAVLCLGGVLVESIAPVKVAHAGPAEDSTKQRLQAELESSRVDLVETRRKVETARKKLIARIEAKRRDIRTLEQQLESDRQLFRQLNGQQSADLRATEESRLQTGQLARRLASEGLEVDTRADANRLLEVWPQVVDATEVRLDRWAADLRAERVDQLLLDRSGAPIEVPVWRWGAVQRIALGKNLRTRGICRRLDDGQWQVAGPDLEADQTSEAPMRPVDITGRLALREASPRGLLAWVQRAGLFAWPIISVGLIGLLLILDRLFLWWRWRLPHNLIELLNSAQPPALANYRAPAIPVLEEILRGDAASREERAGAALVEAEVRLQRGLRLLGVLAATAPLLGLLGTVTGMIRSFHALDLESGNDPAQLSTGIGEALLTTELGLIVAVPLLLVHAVFVRDAQRRLARAESAAMRLLATRGTREKGEDSREGGEKP